MSNNSIIRLFIILALFYLAIFDSSAQSLSATIETSVARSTSGETFEYTYKVISNASNIKDFELFQVFTADKPKKRFGGTIINFRQAKEKTKWKGWGSPDNYELRVNIVQWAATKSNVPPPELNTPHPEVLKPGETLEGIGFTSTFLPGATMYGLTPWYKPRTDEDIVNEYNLLKSTNVETIYDIPEKDLDKLLTNTGGYARGRATGITLSALFDPTGKSVADILNYLIDQKHQAQALGWLSGPGVDGIEKSLDAKLNAAKDAVSRGQSHTARNQLSAFLNEVEAQKGKALNNNAYLLIKLNAEYILTKLPEK